ncbi:hypothetical protein MTO96_005539 [Rhipicephalus appendiculatus]
MESRLRNLLSSQLPPVRHGGETSGAVWKRCREKHLLTAEETQAELHVFPTRSASDGVFRGKRPVKVSPAFVAVPSAVRARVLTATAAEDEGTSGPAQA